MDNLDFSEEEIQQQLELLGHTNVPRHKLQEFKQDLEQLIQNGGLPNLPTPSADAKVDPRPPAFTKEKVSLYDVSTLAGRVFRHNKQGNTQVLSRHPSKDGQLQQDQEAVPGSSHSAAAPTLVPDTQGRHFIKRKVLRKCEGQSLVCDESVYSQNSDCSAFLQDRLSGLRLHEAQSDKASVLSDDMEGVSLSSFGSFITHSTRTRSESDFRTKPKSFIRPVLTQQTFKKDDPVARYFQYKQLWDGFRIPGERDHRELRWEIRERLAYQAPVPKARRSYVANSYVIPTDKKRSALRWEVRNRMAHPDLPHKFAYHF
ncbi:centriolar and ciliogenesis-associated protein HYLS1 [Syngnathoides biaculeatus]|uniref:centriolar and ciliogenesis-associated protein HYLS1 n=1 Tax=Syngnathoides biaculeatus TaxID=300417 RepID=UPI002ADD38A4|nr:centriolar and ciliogenesis-associated protein HYLS1 [Syngnathoides biaculeatus]XP_061687187.1 centriolar and ciliogenesis-associated protein HYLS1 [Syngnathoides biaculeatus]XP_061687188.1 centriolar and ciliogenesis-associated protein HYLS1 [Syngnathoides biaculeatus]XP_061687189.1 centriolar and ciliogenesis-associated protein HYLS1 [Syngnathoides biaculeatus]XP_061687190.1 centriolar and ciliogenesis-associated protein HYLS1 [Syngnathoides biaculeatus]